MRHLARLLFTAAVLFGASLSLAQMNPASMRGLAGMQMAEPGPELPGDRALSCAQIAREMGAIMKRRDVKGVMQSSQKKLCHGTAVLGQQAREQQRLMTAPMAMSPQQMTLDANQQAARQQASAEMESGMADMMKVMNDPRLIRLGMLAMDKRCEAEMPSDPQPTAAAEECGLVAEPANLKSQARPSLPATLPPAKAADPFSKPATPAAKPATSDPFAKR